jgi:hypothetical protein
MLTQKNCCDYDTCVALKELGYDGKRSNYCYIEKNKQQLESEAGIFLKVFRGEKYTFVNAIHLYEAQKWLREEKGLFIEITICFGKYDVNIIRTKVDEDNTHRVLCEICGFNSYEEALSEGIKKVVKLLKECENTV